MGKDKEYNIFTLIEEFPKIGKLTVARLYSHVEIAGKKREVCATGKSKCCLQDKYDRTFGVALAYTRAMIRLNKKLENLLLRETHKPEWRKPNLYCMLGMSNFNLEDIEFELSGKEIKKGDIVEININGIKTKCRVVIKKNKGIGKYTIELKRLMGENNDN